MITSDWRRVVTGMALIVMDAIWFAPLLLIVWPWTTPWIALTAELALFMLAWTVALNLLARLRVALLWQRGVALLLLIGSGLLLLHALIYREISLLSPEWLARLAQQLNPAARGSQTVWALLIAHFYVWQRAAWTTGRRLDMPDVGLAFRIEMVLLLISGLLYRYTGRQAGRELLDTGPVWLFLGAGILALTLARSSEQALGAPGERAPLSARRVAGIGVLIAGVLGAGFGLRQIVPGPLRIMLGWLQPLWEIVFVLFEVIAVFISMVTVDLARAIASLFRGKPALDLRGLAELTELVQQLLRKLLGPAAVAALPPWVVVAVQVIVVIVSLGLLSGAVLIFVQRLRLRRTASAHPTESGLQAGFDGNLLQLAAQQAKAWLHLARRYGINRALLAAISVQNIYANLCRTAGRRGFARHPAEAPDAYLPRLIDGFEGHAARLGRITEAYMRVDYGEHPVSPEELRGLRSDYRAVLRGDSIDG